MKNVNNTKFIIFTHTTVYIVILFFHPTLKNRINTYFTFDHIRIKMAICSAKTPGYNLILLVRVIDTRQIKVHMHKSSFYFEVRIYKRKSSLVSVSEE